MKRDQTYRIKGGYAGSILWVNLTTEKVKREKLNEEMVRSFIGMRGFTSKLLWDRVKGVDAYDPKNLTMFAIGPLAGVTPTGGRALIAAKSPLTGLIGYANFGGHWGPALKFAGYDLVVVEGKAETPVYLWIEDDHVEIRDASGLWGKDTRETVKAIQRELGQAAHGYDVGTARACGYVRGAGHSACNPGWRPGGAVHAQRRLQHDVRSWHYRPGKSCPGYWHDQKGRR